MGLSALLAAAAILPGAASAAPMTHSLLATTGKSLDRFGECFVAGQERGSRSWWFVPNDEGGTFSNLGAANPAEVYFLHLMEIDGGNALQVRLETIGPRASQRLYPFVSRCL